MNLESKNGNGNGKNILTIKEVSQLLRIPISTIYDLAKRGKIRGAKFGKHWRFLEDEIINYLKGGLGTSEA